MTLNDLTESQIREIFQDLKDDRISLSESPNFEEVQMTASKWQERAANLQEVKTT